MNCPRLFTALFLAALAAFILSCGGGNSSLSRSSVVNTSHNTKPNVLTRDGELAKLEALPKPANIGDEQWNDLKASMAAIIPAKIVSVPPSSDENVTDLAFSRDAEGVGYLTWSYWLRNDYNRDGIVDINDVAEIAQHFGEAVADSPANWILDTSGDGFVGISDVTGIAQRYGLSLINFGLREYSSETHFTEIDLIPRGAATYDETGVMHFSIPYDNLNWADLAIVPQDMLQTPGGASNMVLFHPVRIQSVSVPSGEVGSEGTFSVEVLGEEPISYDWVLTNGCDPKRATDPTVDVTLVAAGTFNGRVKVSNLYGSDERSFQVVIGIPPTIESVSPNTGETGQRIPISALVTGSGPRTYFWSFEGGFPATSDETLPTIEFDADGAHSCSLSVSNTYGTASYPFTVTTGSMPEVVKVTPLVGAVDKAVNFSAEVLGTPPFSYSWNFVGMSEPSTSGEPSPSVTITKAGTFQCKLTVNNTYGSTDFWFNFTSGAPPFISEILWTSTTGNEMSWFFADVTGDFPMTWNWTFDMFAPSPPLSFTGIPAAVILPGTLGTYNCRLEAINAFGSDVKDFQFEITDVGEPPPPA